MNRKQTYIQYFIFPIIPLIFTILCLVYAGYETNISILLSKPKIRIFPLVLCGITLVYLFWKSKNTTNQYVRVLFFLCAVLTLIFPYIELAFIKNMHLIFAYSTLILYVIPVSYTHLDVYKRQGLQSSCLSDSHKKSRISKSSLPGESLVPLPTI